MDNRLPEHLEITKNLVLALLHQPIKFVRFHIGSDLFVLALFSGIIVLIKVKLNLQYSV